MNSSRTPSLAQSDQPRRWVDDGRLCLSTDLDPSTLGHPRAPLEPERFVAPLVRDVMRSAYPRKDWVNWVLMVRRYLASAGEAAEDKFTASNRVVVRRTLTQAYVLRSLLDRPSDTEIRRALQRASGRIHRTAQQIRYLLLLSEVNPKRASVQQSRCMFSFCNTTDERIRAEILKFSRRGSAQEFIKFQSLSPSHESLGEDWTGLRTSRHICFALTAFQIDPQCLWSGEGHVDLLRAAMVADAVHQRLKALQRPRTKKADDTDDWLNNPAPYVDAEAVPIFRRGPRRPDDGDFVPALVEARHISLKADDTERRFLEAFGTASTRS